jgi:hypothetical protein
MKNRVFDIAELSFSYTCKCGLVLIFKPDVKFNTTDNVCPSCGSQLHQLKNALAAWQRFSESAKDLTLRLRTPRRKPKKSISKEDINSELAHRPTRQDRKGN